ncbi:MAG: hypothetical protein IT490_05380 [Candidatus Contendobacter sp.]|nr:hypothetical protein [Candidatus Contendobacter sp.]
MQCWKSPISGLLNVEKDGRQDCRWAGESRGGYAGYGGCDGWREKSRDGREVVGVRAAVGQK